MGRPHGLPCVLAPPRSPVDPGSYARALIDLPLCALVYLPPRDVNSVSLDVIRQPVSICGRPNTPCDAMLRALDEFGSGAGLTPAELKVLPLMAYGYTTKRIAAMLCISVNTARTHVARVLRKTGRSRMQLHAIFRAEER